MAGKAVYLASPESDGMTSQVLTISGGSLLALGRFYWKKFVGLFSHRFVYGHKEAGSGHFSRRFNSWGNWIGIPPRHCIYDWRGREVFHRLLTQLRVWRIRPPHPRWKPPPQP